MVIRKAVAADISAVGKTYDALMDYEAIHGSTSNWVKGVYPTTAWAQECFAQDTLFVLEEDGEITASMILNQQQAEAYAFIPWEYPAADEAVMVIHTLCIPPQYQGRGYGNAMVRFAAEYAKAMGCEVLRIDTWEGNRPAAALYQKMGYRIAGSAAVMHQGVIPETLIFLEYRIPDTMKQ